jgi:hypothetical protein
VILDSRSGDRLVETVRIARGLDCKVKGRKATMVE